MLLLLLTHPDEGPLLLKQTVVLTSGHMDHVFLQVCLTP